MYGNFYLAPTVYVYTYLKSQLNTNMTELTRFARLLTSLESNILYTVVDKIKFPLCTDSPPTCELSCQQKSPKSRPKVASNFRRTLNIIKKVADLFLPRDKFFCAHNQFRPKSLACTNRTRAAILLISARYFIVYLHSTVACHCLLCLLRYLFSSLPVPLGVPVSYFHFHGFFGLVFLRYRTVRDSVVRLSSIAWYSFFSF